MNNKPNANYKIVIELANYYLQNPSQDISAGLFDKIVLALIDQDVTGWTWRGIINFCERYLESVENEK